MKAHVWKQIKTGGVTWECAGCGIKVLSSDNPSHHLTSKHSKENISDFLSTRPEDCDESVCKQILES